MAEGSDLVRTVQNHLRRAGTLLAARDLTAASAEVDAALKLDPQSLPAQALRDRITRMSGSREMKQDVSPPNIRFVPTGVNAQSWMGFEQRIQERRFRALVESMQSAIAAGDFAGARLALEEARELRPEAPELTQLESTIAAVPLPAAAAASPLRSRALGAIGLLLMGISLLFGLEWMHPSETVNSIPQVMPHEPDAIAPDDPLPAIESDEEPIAKPPDEEHTPVPIAAVNAIEFRPRGTSGTVTRPRRSVDSPPRRDTRSGEIPDDYVVRPTRAVLAEHQPSARSTVTESPVPAANLMTSPPPMTSPRPAASASVSNAASTTPPVALTSGEQGKVEDVLRRYARAYADLDAGAARAVWPTVDERALARAFQGLASQDVSFDTCDIQIRGAVANASCRGQASYVGKVGSREPRTEARLWRFELRRDGEAWTIENAEARRTR